MKTKMIKSLMMLVVGSLLFLASSVNAALVTYDFFGTEDTSGYNFTASITLDDASQTVTSASGTVDLPGGPISAALNLPVSLDTYNPGVVIEIFGADPVALYMLYQVDDPFGFNLAYLKLQDGTTYVSYDMQSSNFAVPLPGSAWLIGTGLFGLLGLRRKK